MLKKFKESFNTTVGTRLGLSDDEVVLREYKRLGKDKDVSAVITSGFNLFIDDSKVDTFKSEKEADKGLISFLKVMEV